MALVLGGCGSGDDTLSAGGPAVFPQSTVTGTVVDADGRPVQGATVTATGAGLAAMKGKAFETSSGPFITKTDSRGSFSLTVGEGNYQLSISINNIFTFETQFSTVDGNSLDLGAINVTWSPSDNDGDGVEDKLEESGWSIFVNEEGMDRLALREVSSDPSKADTDNDGLSDGEEFALKTDPRKRDTEGDLLNDFDEVNVYKSNPADVDTDGDARGPKKDQFPNPSLFDGAELKLSRTSPTLADTDGDGLTDYEEIIGGGFNPLRADLPSIDLELVGDPSVTLNVLYEGETVSNEVNTTFQRNLAENTKTDTESTRETTENTQRISSEVSAGCCPLGGKAKVKASAEFKQGFMNETSSSWTQSSVEESQNTFETNVTQRNVQTFEDGTVQVGMRFRNSSDLSFRLLDLSIVAFRLQSSQTSGAFTVVGTLRPETLPAEGLVLGPGADYLFVAQNDAINAQNILPLMSNPTGMLFEVGGFSLFQTDELGNPTRDFAVVGQNVIERCALIVIDFGDGRIERHFIATNVQRTPDGRGAGITMRQALQNILGIEYETANDARGIESLIRIDDKQFEILPPSDTDPDAPPRPKTFWLTTGSSSAFDPGSTVGFSDIPLKNGDRISLVFLSDPDGDGLYDREEQLLGSSKNAVDTDGDGLTDFEEAKEGWLVEFRDINGNILPQYSRQVFPDPRFSDVDLDGLTDIEERALGTDPSEADTDEDGLNDPDDPFPLDAPDLPGIPNLGLLAHYPFTGTATDESRNGNDGVFQTFRDPRTYTLDVDCTQPGGVYDFGDRLTSGTATAFYFHQRNNDPGEDGPFGYIEADPPFIDPNLSLTMAAWVFHDPGPGCSTERSIEQPILVQDGNEVQADTDGDFFPDSRVGWAGLFIRVVGGQRVVSFEVPDGDGGVHVVQDPEPLPSREWHLFMGIYDAKGSTIRLYRDGTQVAGPVSAPVNLNGINSRIFRIGASVQGCPLRFSGGVLQDEVCQFYQGSIDDIRIYRRVLNDTEIRAIFRER